MEKKNHSIIQKFPITLVCAQQQIALMPTLAYAGLHTLIHRQALLFPPTLNPKTIEAMAGKCEYYRSNQKVRYAKVLSAPRKYWLLGLPPRFGWGTLQKPPHPPR